MTSSAITSTVTGGAGNRTRTTSFANTLASEWSKMASLRATHLTLALGFFLSVATSAIAAFAMGASNAEWPTEFDPILFSMVGNIFALIVFSVFGVLAVSREYTSGMIRLSLVATPNRSRILVAKLLLVGGITLVVGMLTTISMFLVGQTILGAYGLPHATLADPNARWVVFGLGATMAFFPILGLAFGVLLRSTAGGITTVLGILWLPQIFSAVAPLWAREHIISLMPGTALDSLTIGQMKYAPEYSATSLAAVLVTGWLLAIVGAAFLFLRQRDA
ncbi:MAG: ABC transporter permease [bacterium]